MAKTPSREPGLDNDAVFLPDLCGVHALFVVVISSELVAFIVIIARHGFGPSFVDELALLSMYTQWLGLSSAGALCLARRPLAGRSERTIAIASFLLVVAIAWLVAELAWWVLNPVVGAGAIIQIRHDDLVWRTVCVAAIVAALVLRYFYVQFHWKQRMASEASARLEALQARIRPHFFFNCMNTIASLTRSDPPLAERAVEDLADLFRASLADAREPVSFATEIDFVERYLSIERLRLGERLQIDWQLETLPASARLPLLSLQPIVENAIYHGIEPSRGGGTIVIAARSLANRLEVTVSNPFEADSATHHHDGNRIALNNVRQRLRAHFGDDAELHSEQRDGRYVVCLRVPLAGAA
ncbi:MAG: histidine kinase [Gammaproteobacteria bacterium]|nr:histidine kinase [Gammaproteobacteria bacterium]